MDLTLGLLAFAAPIAAVLVGFLLTAKKLRHQDKRVEQVHVLVNSQLSEVLNELTRALVNNIHLKEQAGKWVTDEERATARALLRSQHIDPAEIDLPSTEE